jgi:hypothetical protein
MTNRQILDDTRIAYDAAYQDYVAKKQRYETARETLCPSAEVGAGHVLEQVVEREWSGPYRESFYVQTCTLCGYSV